MLADRPPARGFHQYVMADVMAEFHDGPHATPPPSEDGPIYLGIKNLTDGGSLDLSSVRHIAEPDFSQWTRRVTPRPGDLVFTYEATLHRYALIPRGFRGCLGRRIALIRPRTDVVDPTFLHLLMLGPEWRGTIEDRVITGATVDRIPIIDFPSFPISLPTLAVQRRIAAALGAFDELIEINERRIELLEDLARSLYREWFVRFRFPGHDDYAFVGSELGMIPNGWAVQALASVGQFLNGFAFKPSHWGAEGLPIIKIKELKQGVLSNTPRNSDDLPSKFTVEPGDLLFSWSADLAAYLWPGERGLLNQHLFKVTPCDGMTREFLFHALDDALPQFRARAQGTTMKHIKRSALREVSVVIPDPRLLQEFSAAVAPAHAERLALTRATTVLAATRDLLLPRLVTGRLDISDIDLGDLLPADAA